MRAHVLLNLLNELGKSDKIRGLPSILLLFRNEVKKVSYTGARMLDSIYHMIWAVTCGFLAMCVDSDELVQPSVKFRYSK